MFDFLKIVKRNILIWHKTRQLILISGELDLLQKRMSVIGNSGSELVEREIINSRIPQLTSDLLLVEDQLFVLTGSHVRKQ